MPGFDREDIVRAIHPLTKPPKEPDTIAVEVELIAGRDAGVWKIVGVRNDGDLERSLMQGFRDYSGANGVGTRGVKQVYVLSAGPIYEIKAPISWKKIDHYFFRIHCGTQIRMNIHQVLAWLKNDWA